MTGGKEGSGKGKERSPALIRMEVGGCPNTPSGFQCQYLEVLTPTAEVIAQLRHLNLQQQCPSSLTADVKGKFPPALGLQ